MLYVKKRPGAIKRCGAHTENVLHLVESEAWLQGCSSGCKVYESQSSSSVKLYFSRLVLN